MLRKLLASLRQRPTRSAAARPPRARPTLEALEDRSLMTVSVGFDPLSGFTGATALVNPLLATNAADGTNRLFVVEQRGRILVRQPNGTVGVFLDISANAANPAHRRVQSGGEQGLLGLAFHPQFETNGLFYVHHTRVGLTNTNDIVEYRVPTPGANAADPDSQRLLLRIPQPFSNHNGGSIEFGPFDGMLYIAKGDGGGANDQPGGGFPGNRAQSLDFLLGKVLRIDVNRDDFPADPNRNYGIPADNPFVGVDGADEIFALGLRNPYRVSFDRADLGGTGLLFVGDVGQGTREEVSVVTLGGNYGWRPFEGDVGTPAIAQAERDAIQAFALSPITAYATGALGRAVTGGYVYRGSQGTIPEGSYLFGDFISGNVFLFNNGVRTTLANIGGGTVSSFGEDEAGELYIVNYNGSVSRVRSTSSDLPPVLDQPADQTVPSAQDVVVVALSATDPNPGTTLTFSATAQSLALVLDRRLGLRTDGGNLYENFFGAGERWLLGRNGPADWYFILPNGELYQWDFQPSATGTLVGRPGSFYHANIDLLYDAEQVYNLDVGRGFFFGGDLYENYGGRGERWFLDSQNRWNFIVPDGRIYLWDGVADTANGTVIATVGTSYHTFVSLLYEGTQQAPAALSVSDTTLTIDRDDGIDASLVVTATASDGEFTNSRTFNVLVTG